MGTDNIKDIILDSLADSAESVMFNKTLWGYWHQNIEDSPDFIRLFNLMNKSLNPDFKVTMLDETSVLEYFPIDYKTFRENVSVEEFAIKNYADVVRLYLLIKYGGVWYDSSGYIDIPNNFDEYLKKFGFWCPLQPHVDDTKVSYYEATKFDRIIMNWMIAGFKDNLYLKEWLITFLDFIFKKRSKKLKINHDLDDVNYRIYADSDIVEKTGGFPAYIHHYSFNQLFQKKIIDDREYIEHGRVYSIKKFKHMMKCNAKSRQDFKLNEQKFFKDSKVSLQSILNSSLLQRHKDVFIKKLNSEFVIDDRL